MRGLAALLLAASLAMPAAAEAAAPPLIASAWVTEVTASSAELHAEIDAEGLPSTYRFQYESETAYTANLAAGRDGFSGAASLPAGGASAGSGTSSEPVLQRLTGLSAATAYRYRVLAESSAGPATGTTRPLETEETAPVFSLLDGRGWEMVSPVAKNGGAVQGFGANFGGDLLQAAVGGEEVTYSSASSFAGGAGAPAASQYLATRGSSGWSSANITGPQSSAPEPQAGSGVPFRAFSEDLSSALVAGGGGCSAPGEGCADPGPPPPGSGAPPGYQDYYLREQATGTYRALITTADAPSLGLTAEAFEVHLAGATPDLSHVVLSTCAALIPGAAEEPAGEGCAPGRPNLYEWSGGTLSLISFGSAEASPPPPAVLAAPIGAISTDGRRVYWSDPHSGRLYLHEGGEPERQVAGAGAGAATFQAASADGRLAFFTEGTAGAETLYRYEAGTGTSELLAEGVEGVLGATPDGSLVYYQGADGLFLWDDGRTVEISAGSEVAEAADWPPATGAARVAADGTLAFASKAEPTGYDDADAVTGLPDSELYVYEPAAGSLTCASCNPTGERPLGPSWVPGAPANGEGEAATEIYRPRSLSADGRRLFFDSGDDLVLQDTDHRTDVYEWEAGGEGTCAKAAGCVGAISSGREAEAAQFIDASASGGDVFFLTSTSLVPSDPGSEDLYDAREGGGFPVAPAPIPCDGDACEPLPSPPEDPTPGTVVPSGGNPPPHTAEAVRPRRRRKHRKHHHPRRDHRKGRRR